MKNETKYYVVVDKEGFLQSRDNTLEEAVRECEPNLKIKRKKEGDRRSIELFENTFSDVNLVYVCSSLKTAKELLAEAFEDYYDKHCGWRNHEAFRGNYIYEQEGYYLELAQNEDDTI